jgi:formate dehydrogenase subunit gamma
MSSVADADRASSVRAIAERYLTSDRGPLLPILHEVVSRFGYVDRPDVVAIADVLNLSVAEVHGVVSFYQDFRTTPPAEHEVRLCRGEACQAVGAEELFARTTSDVAAGTLGGDVSLHEVFCLGNCALGPSGTVDGTLHGRLDAQRLTALTEGWRA